MIDLDVMLGKYGHWNRLKFVWFAFKYRRQNIDNVT